MKKLPRAAPESSVWLLEDERGMNGAEAGLAALEVGTQLKLWCQQHLRDHRMVQVRRGSETTGVIESNLPAQAGPPAAYYLGCVLMAFEVFQEKTLHNLSGT